jgi:hypothetical protein
MLTYPNNKYSLNEKNKLGANAAKVHQVYCQAIPRQPTNQVTWISHLFPKSNLANTSIPLLRYALHTLCFSHLSKLQRTWALGKRNSPLSPFVPLPNSNQTPNVVS